MHHVATPQVDHVQATAWPRLASSQVLVQGQSDERAVLSLQRRPYDREIAHERQAPKISRTKRYRVKLLPLQGRGRRVRRPAEFALQLREAEISLAQPIPVCCT